MHLHFSAPDNFVIGLILLSGLLLDALFGEVRRFHPLVGFGWLADRADAIVGESRWRTRVTGGIAVTLLAGSVTMLVSMLTELPVVGMILSILFLYISLGARSLGEHADRVYRSLLADDLVSARAAVGFMVSRDTASMDPAEVTLACIESVLENGNDAVFGTLFWFVFFGAPGAVCYRLVNTLDAMWGYRTCRYRQFGWAAARIDDALNWIPARLCALTYSLLGNKRQALQCWRRQAATWESPNAGPVMAAGAGALNIQLGGAGRYHGKQKFRPILGAGRTPIADDIPRAIKLIQHGIILWVFVIAIGASVLD